VTCKLVYLARRAKTVSREDWPRTWKSHAVFASQFPVLEAKIEWMRYCNRIDVPTLDGQEANVPSLSSEHDGVSVASAESIEGLNGAGFSNAERALIDEDELRVFDMLTPNFTWYCDETLLIDGPALEFAVFRFFPRKEGASREAFDSNFIEAHRALGEVPGINRLALNHPIGDVRPLFPYEGILEAWFETEDEAVRALSGPALDVDLSTVSDTDRSVTMLTRISHRWPKTWTGQ